MEVALIRNLDSFGKCFSVLVHVFGVGKFMGYLIWCSREKHCLSPVLERDAPMSQKVAFE